MRQPTRDLIPLTQDCASTSRYVSTQFEGCSVRVDNRLPSASIASYGSDKMNDQFLVESCWENNTKETLGTKVRGPQQC